MVQVARFHRPDRRLAGRGEQCRCRRAPSPGIEQPAKPVVITGVEVPELAAFDKLMSRFIAEHGIPGGSLAIIKDGRVVYARGFGYADRKTKAPVEPTSLFRIASISKPFTAVAILQLVERGKLRLDDKPFELLGLKPYAGKDAKPDPRLKQITVLELLHHTGGWDSIKSFDPMFRSVAIAKAFGTSRRRGSGRSFAIWKGCRSISRRARNTSIPISAFACWGA